MQGIEFLLRLLVDVDEVFVSVLVDVDKFAVRVHALVILDVIRFLCDLLESQCELSHVLSPLGSLFFSHYVSSVSVDEIVLLPL